ncbi:MAG TPA: ABC-type transport auxiliary lipoprotein family protein [Gammaproteobacteria bacterium]|nr:ABC-type transport auxiliary lipoprotein family protein [Gammaproteobacteria bacterium]
MKKTAWFFIALSIFLISSCSLLSSAPTEPEHRYVLNTLPDTTIKKPRRQITLFVAEPTASASYNTEQMAYCTQPYQINYFVKNSWNIPPAEMLQPLIIQTLQNTHHYHAVISESVAGQADYILNTQIEKLLQDYSHQRAELHLIVRAEIVRTANYKVIASKQFIIIKPILAICPNGGVYAANQATAEMLRQLAQFCLKNI